MKKHTLLATTGASPQVVTETLYAIHHANQRWPDDIYLITTSFGKRKAVEGLLEKQHLQRLCEELQRPIPAFDASHVLVTPGADGTEVEDARSLADHEALANFIMTEVRDRTASDDTSLHASLAGGRKTMTFYIGYAMSLFGRPQDTLSHVLVSEGYENIPDFWFPTRAEPHRYVDNRGKSWTPAPRKSPWLSSPLCVCAMACQKHCTTEPTALLIRLQPFKKVWSRHVWKFTGNREKKHRPSNAATSASSFLLYSLPG